MDYFWKNSPLFRDISNEELDMLLQSGHCQVRKYPKGKFVFLEGDRPRSLYLLMKGRISISQTTMSGKRILITDIDHPGELFGEVYLFIEKEAYDMDARAEEDAVVLELSHQILGYREGMIMDNRDAEGNLADLYSRLQYNLMGIFAQKAYQMNRKVKVLGASSIREKIARYLLERRNEEGLIIGNLLREEMAEYMNVTRPSLSRELGKMQKEKILEIRGRDILVLNQEKLEEYL